MDPTTHLTFNLHLSKKEREAKDSLTLPFQFSSENSRLYCALGWARLPATSSMSQMLMMTWIKKTQTMT